jgi:hypothetical protein
MRLEFMRLEDVKKCILETWSNFGLENRARLPYSDRWTFGIHFGSDEILAKSIFSHLPDGTGTLAKPGDRLSAQVWPYGVGAWNCNVYARRCWIA